MAFTHLFMSLAMATAVLPAVSEHAAPPLVLLAAVVGGLSPDLDLLVRHRRTLHYPVVFPLLALASLGLVLSTGSSVALLAGVLFGAAALHVLSDVLGGSAERAPWDPVTEFGVYNHVMGRWHRPRRYVQYSGSPGDFALGAGLAATVVLSPATNATVDVAIAGLVVVALGYSLARKRFSALSTFLVECLPPRLRRLLPVLLVEERDGGGTTVAIRLDR
jgi:hypothetical protein